MKWFLFSASITGFLAVLMGAAGDHALAHFIAGPVVDRWHIALQYHQLYSIVLLALSLYGLSSKASEKLFKFSMAALLAGMLFFSGSLYLSIFLKLEYLTYLTPVGGSLLMVGWVSLALYAFRIPKGTQG